MCRLSNGAESPITAGDANRPLAAQDLASEAAFSSNGSHIGSGILNGSAVGGSCSGNGAGAGNGEVSPHSGRPDQLKCRLLVDCMVNVTASLTSILHVVMQELRCTEAT